jgi:hypothetical protein
MAAPLGNKYAQGLETSGRPPMYDDPQKLSAKIIEYFESHLPVEKETDDGDKEMIYSRPITITGLCLYLGFESRQSFYEYGKKQEFTYIIKRARLVIESFYEENLTGKTPTGSIFALKNMDWIDRQELTGKGGDPLIPAIVFKDFTDGRP